MMLTRAVQLRDFTIDLADHEESPKRREPVDPFEPRYWGPYKTTIDAELALTLLRRSLAHATARRDEARQTDPHNKQEHEQLNRGAVAPPGGFRCLGHERHRKRPEAYHQDGSVSARPRIRSRCPTWIRTRTVRRALSRSNSRCCCRPPRCGEARGRRHAVHARLVRARWRGARRPWRGQRDGAGGGLIRRGAGRLWPLTNCASASGQDRSISQRPSDRTRTPPPRQGQ